MYTKDIPYKNYKGQVKNKPVHFMLETHQVFKLFVQLNNIFSWRDSIKDQDRKLTDEEMVDFFDNFEVVLLSAWGIPSEDGERFERAERYLFEESKLFAATMDLFISDPGECIKMLDEMMPKGMEELVKKQAASLERLNASLGSETDPKTRAAIEKQIAELTSRLESTQNNETPSSD